MRAQFFNLSLFAIFPSIAGTAFAEPPVQAGEPLESLSKVKTTTTVNGQLGS